MIELRNGGGGGFGWPLNSFECGSRWLVTEEENMKKTPQGFNGLWFKVARPNIVGCYKKNEWVNL